MAHGTTHEKTYVAAHMRETYIQRGFALGQTKWMNQRGLLFQRQPRGRNSAYRRLSAWSPSRFPFSAETLGQWALEGHSKSQLSKLLSILAVVPETGRSGAKTWQQRALRLHLFVLLVMMSSPSSCWSELWSGVNFYDTGYAANTPNAAIDLFSSNGRKWTHLFCLVQEGPYARKR